MWPVGSIALEPVEFDFSSSWGGKHRTRALVVDGEILVNMVDRAGPDEPPDELGQFQVEVCEQCGIVHCSPGAWVAARRIHDILLWIPAFESMTDLASANEYGPPSSLRKKGCPYFRGDVLASLLDALPWHQRMPLVPQLVLREAILIAQFEAPFRVLGRFPEPARLDRSRIIAADPGRLDAEVALLQACLAAAASSQSVVLAVPATAHATLYLDDRAVTEWQPLSRDHHDGLALRLAGDIHVSLVEVARSDIS
jgi:hypothetical protein